MPSGKSSGNARPRSAVSVYVTTFEEIRNEIEHLSERRTELWQTLSQGGDESIGSELKAIDARLDRLWAEQRQLRARLRFGDRAKIVARARVEERLERAA